MREAAEEVRLRKDADRVQTNGKSFHAGGWCCFGCAGGFRSFRSSVAADVAIGLFFHAPLFALNLCSCLCCCIITCSHLRLVFSFSCNAALSMSRLYA